ncbi:nucleic acid/nucleotide deaminase domain-containing protein, partial [Streptomyces sp. NPDC048057]|uniref:nucleic acid/nucleotide deaminase domain-containing protein n=1 Tax=Streptomyces sp. NPDC048057 TaxID=3155628 RepID=UPI0033F7D9C4
DETTVKMSKEIEKNVEGLDKTKKQNDQDDKKAKDDIDQCEPGDKKDGDGDDTPMYLLNRDGTVQEIKSDGTLGPPITKTGSDGINEILQPNGKVWRGDGAGAFPGKPFDANATVDSRKLQPGETSDLMHATQLARYARQDYKGGNYASASYVGADGKEIILVGHSGGPHSERSIAYPVLAAGKKDNVQAMYTERAPCNGASHYCEKWLAKHFDSDLDVTHSARYDQNESDKTRNAEHRRYREQLQEWHKANGPTEFPNPDVKPKQK